MPKRTALLRQNVLYEIVNFSEVRPNPLPCPLKSRDDLDLLQSYSLYVHAEESSSRSSGLLYFTAAIALVTWFGWRRHAEYQPLPLMRLRHTVDHNARKVRTSTDANTLG
jgi:hypothetical protein